MNERLNLQDLVDLLAKKQEITKKNAELFLKELFILISQNLENLEPVKIKDFGTLKPILVNARKSVNVNTGEEFEIAAHYKLGFAPDKTLREIANKPFSHFESVILEDGVTFDNIDTDIAELISENETEEFVNIDEINKEEESLEVGNNINTHQVLPEIEVQKSGFSIDSEEKDIQESIVENIDTSSYNNIEKEVCIECEIKIANEETQQFNDIITTCQIRDGEKEIKVENPIISVADFDPVSSNLNEKTKSKTKSIIIIVAIILIVGLGIWGYSDGFVEFMVNNETTANSDREITSTNADTTPKDTIKNDILSSDSSKLGSLNENNLEEPISENVDLQARVNTVAPSITDTPELKIKIESGNTLRLLGLKYFGNKTFWVYIYQNNKDRIKDPNNVPIGTELVIPTSSKYGIDAKNTKSVEKAKLLEQELYKQFSL